MPVEFGTESNYAKEMRRWESTHTRFGPPGRPYVFQEWPKMFYRAERVPGKGIEIAESRQVNDEQEARNLQSRGFHFGPEAAVQAIQDEQREHGVLAAEREYAIQHGQLSESATAEVRAAEQMHGARHLPDVPETPIKRRGGRPKKIVSPTE